MHISEGFLPPVHAIGWTLASAPFVVQGFRAVKQHLDERPEDKVTVASAGAFAFVLSAMKIPSVTGSSSHPTGVGLGTVMFKPKVMTALGSIVLLFQALLLAHGGITTLGANIFSMAIVGPWASWFVFRTLSRTGRSLSVTGGIASEVLDLLDRLHVSGTSIVLSTHDIDLAAAWASSIAVLHEGKVVASGNPSLLADAQLVTTARLRRPSVAMVWEAMPVSARPERCPRSVEELAGWMRTKSSDVAT